MQSLVKIDREKQRMLHEGQEREIKRRLAAKGWQDNTFTRYLLQIGLTPCRMAAIMGVHRSVVCRWTICKNEELTPFCRWVFLAFAKLKLQGVSVENYF